ncbi:MAG TPA: hypothetical protein VL172_16830, partial [Kofleriaceae bacterium]|nr:hypothetical protein [Kofleriaceae bacterium]
MPPRVLFVSRALHPVSGGGERAVAAAALARALAAHGARVLAVTPAIDDRPARHGLARRLEPLRIDGPDGPGALELHEGRLADGRVEVIVPTTADLDQLGRVAVAAAAARAFAPTAVHIEEGAEDAAAALAAAGAPIVTAAAIDRPPGIDEVRWPRRPLAGDRDRAAARRRLLDRLDLEPRPRRPLIAALGPFERELLDDAGTAALAARCPGCSRWSTATSAPWPSCGPATPRSPSSWPPPTSRCCPTRCRPGRVTFTACASARRRSRRPITATAGCWSSATAAPAPAPACSTAPATTTSPMRSHAPPTCTLPGPCPAWPQPPLPSTCPGEPPPDAPSMPTTGQRGI